MKFLCWACLPALILAVWTPGHGAPPAALPPAEEAQLYSLRDLGPVDFSPKTLAVEIYSAPLDELKPFLRMLPQVWTKAETFYRRLGVNLVQVPATTRPGPLAPAQRLRLEALPYQEWLARSFQAFNVAPPFRLSFLSVCQNKYAFAHLPLSVVHFSYRRFQEAVLVHEPGGAQLSPQWLANVIIHELGHLMGLFHAHEFINDPVEEFLPDGRTPNFMSHYLTHKGELGWVPWQRTAIHSYLAKGKVFEQYRRVEFDPLRYLELVKQHNDFREPGKEDPRCPRD
jgi:hypothetical protein